MSDTSIEYARTYGKYKATIDDPPIPKSQRDELILKPMWLRPTVLLLLLRVAAKAFSAPPKTFEQPQWYHPYRYFSNNDRCCHLRGSTCSETENSRNDSKPIFLTKREIVAVETPDNSDIS